MTDEIWFEDELLPAQESIESVAASLKTLGDDDLLELTGLEGVNLLTKSARDHEIEAQARAIQGFVRVHYPRAAPAVAEPGDGDSPAAGPDWNNAIPLVRGTPYLVRLGLEFDMPAQAREKAKARYKKIWCRAHVTADDERCLPRVVEVFPDRLFEGEPAMVKVELKPTIKWGPVQGGVGGASTDVQVGVVAPATVGFLGNDEREPYWEMTEKEREIRGRYHFWFMLDVPGGCDPQQVRLGLYGEGDLKVHVGFVPIGPAKRRWSERRHLTLAEILAR